MSRVIEISGAVARQEQFRFFEPIDLTINSGEQIAVVGANGSGKSILAGVIMGRYPLVRGKVEYYFEGSESSLVSDNIRLIAFRDSYGAASDRSYYYQQRWNSCDREGQPKVRDKLPKIENQELKGELYELFGIEDMLDKEMILLSSGELRRFHLAMALLSNPRVLILDNPFIGLDPATREQLNGLLEGIVDKNGLQLILLLARSGDIPDFVTHIVSVSEMRSVKKVEASCYKIEDEWGSVSQAVKRVEALQQRQGDDYSSVVDFNNVTVRYGDRVILDRLTFSMARGEKWAIRGRNGSGKSTLLSLISADNPQRYACDIRLLGKGRNSGQSIWAIKQRIGYVSPEMHRAYMVSSSCLNIVGSGLYDTVGLRTNLSDEQKEVCRFWMGVFGIEGLEERDFMQISSAEQRMVLLARAFVKDPELLILDEPLHGLDTKNSSLVLGVIEAFVGRKGKSLLYVTHYDSELPSVITNTLELG